MPLSTASAVCWFLRRGNAVVSRTDVWACSRRTAPLDADLYQGVRALVFDRDGVDATPSWLRLSARDRCVVSPPAGAVSTLGERTSERTGERLSWVWQAAADCASGVQPIAAQLSWRARSAELVSVFGVSYSRASGIYGGALPSRF